MDLSGPWSSLLMWAFLPRLVTDQLHSFYYGLKYAKNSPSRPSPTSKKYRTHNTRIYTLVIAAYLIYTLTDFFASLPPNHYSVLGLTPGGGSESSFTERDFKMSFRKASLQYHPDKSGGDPDAPEMFMRTREAYEILKHPERRFAYDKFGPEIARSKTCVVRKEFVAEALADFRMFYFGTTVALLILNFSGKGQFGKYWRFVATIFVAGLELSMLLRPRNPLPLQFLLGSFTTHEQIQILHHTFVTFFIALSQIGPMYYPEEPQSVREILHRLNAVSQVNNQQAVHNFKTMFEPFRQDPASFALLKRRMQRIAVESKMNQDANYVTAQVNTRNRLFKTQRG